jgi:hypothetical protein
MCSTNAVDFGKLCFVQGIYWFSIGAGSAGNLLARRDEAELIDAILLNIPPYSSGSRNAGEDETTELAQPKFLAFLPCLS